LIRALEPIAGINLMRKRRHPVHKIEGLASGPGKLTRALGITRSHYGRDVTRGSLTVRDDLFREFEIAVSPRIGIRQCADWPLRFYIRGNPCVSR
jgi:DNA-3-methyladenine glycosylase